jgi:predicted nucleic acid-binding protein
VSIIVLDTDVASASLRNRLPGQLRARLAGHTMAITFVTVGELAKWRALRDWGPRRIADLARWRERVAVLQYDGMARPAAGRSRTALLRMADCRRVASFRWPTLYDFRNERFSDQ